MVIYYNICKNYGKSSFVALHIHNILNIRHEPEQNEDTNYQILDTNNINIKAVNTSKIHSLETYLEKVSKSRTKCAKTQRNYENHWVHMMSHHPIYFQYEQNVLLKGFPTIRGLLILDCSPCYDFMCTYFRG